MNRRPALLLFLSIFGLAAATAEPAANAEPAFSVDRYGQSASKIYPGKITRDEELREDAARNAAPSIHGPALDAFGGLADSGAALGLKKTGYFHVATTAGRQVLVTPEGNLFFQLGVCGIANTDDYTTVAGREPTYEWLPSAREQDEFATAWRPGTPGVFSFYIANWIRKHQRPFTFDEWSGQVVDRLRSWGFNSSGAFSVYSDAMRERGFPYVSMATPHKSMGLKMLPGSIGAGEIMDPFAPGNAAKLLSSYEKRLSPRAATDPLLIGYFLGNEQHFENIPRLVPGYNAFVPAKLRLVELLREKHTTIERFNTAWQPASPFVSFEALAAAPLVVATEAAAADMRAYLELFLDTYHRMVTEALRLADPNHLILGSRFTPGTASSEAVVRIAGKYTDVVSVNYYTYGIEKEFLDRVHAWSGEKPVILGEWYYSTTAQGLGALKEVADENERALAYRNYVEQSAVLPYVVGVQWFIYTDQSITGRFFEGFHGEGYNTGLVNVVDRPYEALVNAASETHARIHDVMLGSKPPFSLDDPRFGQRRGDSRKTLSIPRSLPGLVLDGTTRNWPGRPAEPVTSQGHALGKINPAFRGDFRLCWDEQHLYVLVQIKDPTPMLSRKTGSSLWSADGVELFIGARRLDEPGPMRFDDRQVLLGAGGAGRIHIVNHPDASAKCRVQALKDVGGDGYVISASLPWSVLGIEPSADLELLFDLALNNSDDGAKRHQQIVWNGNAQNSGDRRAWGRARLTEN